MKNLITLKAVLVLILASLIMQIRAQTITVGGIYPGSVTWDVDTVKVTDHIIMDTLTILPGVYVEFQGNYRLTVNYKLNAQGSQDELITFTVNDTTCFYSMLCLDGGWGGILCNQQDSIELSYVKLEYGKTLDKDLYKFGEYVQKMTLYHCIIENNMSSDNILLLENGEKITVQNSVLNQNKAVKAIISGGDDAFMNFIIQTSQINTNSCEYIVNCGEITKAHCIESVISGNIFNSFLNISLADGSTPHMLWNSCIIQYNEGIFQLPTMDMINCDFSYNESNLDVWSEYGIDCIIKDNLFKSNQGYIKFKGSAWPIPITATFENNIFSNNVSENKLIYLFGNISTKMVNNLFDGNLSYTGGAVYLGMLGTAYIYNNTFVNNHAIHGGAITKLDEGGYPQTILVNNIFYHNTADSSLQIAYDPLSSVTSYDFIMFNNLIEDYTELVPLLSETAVDSHNFSADPYFIDETGSDFRLTDSSVCMNAGYMDYQGIEFPEKDLYGVPRIISKIIDIGAYECAVAPTILSEPEDILTCEGYYNEAYCTAKDYTNAKWFKDGVFYRNGIGINFHNITQADSGNYFARIYNEYDSIDSEEIHISVLESPDFYLSADPAEVSTPPITISPNQLYPVKSWSDDSDGDFLIVDSTWEFGEHKVWLCMTNENNCSLTDTLYVTLQEPDGLNDLKNDFEVSLSPNPFTQKSLITLPEMEESTKIYMINALGEVVFGDIIRSTTYELKNKNYKPGIYNVLLINNNKQSVLRVIIY